MAPSLVGQETGSGLRMVAALYVTRRRGGAEQDAEFFGERQSSRLPPGSSAEPAEALRANVGAAWGSGIYLLRAWFSIVAIFVS